MSVRRVAKMHKCPHCEKSFPMPSKLKTHVDGVHLKLKTHKCSYDGCDFGTAVFGNLKMHIRQVHEAKREFKCVWENCKLAYSPEKMH